MIEVVTIKVKTSDGRVIARTFRAGKKELIKAAISAVLMDYPELFESYHDSF